MKKKCNHWWGQLPSPEPQVRLEECRECGRRQRITLDQEGRIVKIAVVQFPVVQFPVVHRGHR